MKSLIKFTTTLLLLLTITNSLFISLTAAEPSGSPTNEDEDFPSVGPKISLRGATHLLPRVPFARCDKNPGICKRVRGKRDCCKKRCVDLTKDRLNCGRCGHKCNFSKICCRGKCVNPLRNIRHCGGCGNACRGGNKCVYGMCSYA
ncbi:stigma-specific Stig1 family protein [Striga asiatica]|uniref:Stigma-specific Stig1 family protein n=1 Tax=Striga asiatica TaxID=4170 RepID=A0A5A7R672_STRAF|nr:stigma-specific Stig1 family protein [Striga asiatica]